LAHQRRVDAWIAPHLDRARRGEAHPVHDFLFTYYTYRPAQLRRWHPGVGVTLSGADVVWPGYRRVASGVTVEAPSARVAQTARFVLELLRGTAQRRPSFGCFGLHEWAMVYRADSLRHAGWPLRLSPLGVAGVVEALPLRCTHFDAYRFFTDAARPRNASGLARESVVETEQGGCLHTNMDLYKWAYKLAPFTPSELVADAFELARSMRELDMRASPYDLTALGYEPVPIETPEGRAAYAAAQRAFARRAAPLRERLATVCERILTGQLGL
jgi:hypothetical protein